MKEKCRRVNERIYQLGKLRKYITNGIANIIYKQAIVPLIDYADFLIESGPTYYIDRVNSLHEKAVYIIDCNAHKNVSVKNLETMYRLEPPLRRRTEHHAAIMFRLSKGGQPLDKHRPTINLRSRKKVRFRLHHRNMQRFLKSPLSRGIKIWDRIPHAIQRSTTKVKFKNSLKQIIRL